MSAIDEIRASRPIDLFGDHRSGLTEQEFRALCGNVPIWHSVDLGDLFVEGARKNSAITAEELRRAAFPDFRGKTVLDIGAHGGFYSFEAERRGASKVTALDYFSWVVDLPRLIQYVASEKAAGRVANAYAPPKDLLDEVGVPGRLVFDTTRRLLGSKVEPVVGVAENYDPGVKFDIVLYLGVLYHCENPLLSLRKVADLTGEMVVIETLGIHYPGIEDRPAWEFYGDDRINNDYTTWWAPNETGLIDMLKSVGFKHVEITHGAAQLPPERRKHTTQIRIWAKAWK